MSRKKRVNYLARYVFGKSIRKMGFSLVCEKVPRPLCVFIWEG